MVGKEQLENYRKWFHNLLMNEFMNFPSADQERFLAIVMKFLEDCKKVAEEGRLIKERRVQIVVESVSENDRITVSGNIDSESTHGIRVRVTLPQGCLKPKLNDKIPWTVYSLDGEIWYSSKKELITGR
jgi:hypothetical protein